MAHSTDYSSQQDIFRLKMSPSQMNAIPKSELKPQSYAYILVSNFLRSNPNWSIDSLFTYCMHQYAEFNVTPTIISRAISSYIDEKYPTHSNN